MQNSNNGLATNNVYSNMMRWQLIATLIVATVAFFIGGKHAGLSVVAGGFSVLIGVWVAAKVAARSQDKTDPTAVLVNLLKAELVKIVTVAILLLIVFKAYKQLIPVALIAGLAAAALLSGAALAKTDKTI